MGEDNVTRKEFNSLTEDLGEMKGLMAKMVDAIGRITLIDERQQVISNFMTRLDDRMGRMEARQHEADIANAVARTTHGRMEALEKGYREMHIDRERDKARFQTVVWMVRTAWAVLGLGGVAALAKYFGGAA